MPGSKRDGAGTPLDRAPAPTHSSGESEDETVLPPRLPTEPASRTTLYRSAFLALVLQWSVRLIGLVSVLILARLLTPEDFGILGLALAALTLVELLGSLGFRQALLRVPEPGRDHLDSAFTIQLILFAGMGLLAIALAKPVAAFYGHAEIAAVIAALSLRFFLLGLVNIGIVDFDRHFQFGRDLRMRLVARLGSFAVTIAAAIALRSYWAPVIGLVSYSAFLAAASYAAHPYRPRLSLKRHSELFGTSLWIFVAAAAQAVQEQIERLTLGRFASAHVVGLYSVSKDVSLIFTSEIATALNRVTFVTVARSAQPLSADPGRVARLVGAYAMIAAPLGLGLAATAEDAVAVLLGPQWWQAAPYLAIVAAYSSLFAVYKVIASSLQASGEARLAAMLSGAGAAALAAAVTGAAALTPDVMAVAAAAAASNLLILAGGIAVIARRAGLGALALGAHVVRPFAAATLMALAVRYGAPETGSALADLTAGILLGLAAYPALLLGLWAAAGRPEGAESEAVAQLRDLRLKRLGGAQPAREG